MHDRGTVKPYKKHVVVCTGVSDWPSKAESDSRFPLISELHSSLKSLPFRTLLSAGDRPTTSTNTTAATSDLLVLPDMKVISSGSSSAVSQWLQDPESPQHNVQVTSLPYTHVILICGHMNRDRRCGTVGPLIKEALEKELKDKEMMDQVLICMVSHVGGHKFAGNVIIYPGGHWYGRVQPCDAKVIVEEHLMKQRVVKERWRGVMDGTLSDSGNDQG